MHPLQSQASRIVADLEESLGAAVVADHLRGSTDGSGLRISGADGADLDALGEAEQVCGKAASCAAP
jgi:hypothetical protein